MITIETVYLTYQGFVFITHTLVLQTAHFRRVLRTESYVEEVA